MGHRIAPQTVPSQAVAPMTPYGPRNGIRPDRRVGANRLMTHRRQRAVPGLLYGRSSRVGLSKQIAEEQKAWKKEKNKFQKHIGYNGHKSII